ncbi:MAG TPA: VIT and VWA domain-containing protein [candidate division Zixibacteria bacterium]
MKRLILIVASLVGLLVSSAWADGFIIIQPDPRQRILPPPLSVLYHQVDVRITNQLCQTSIDQVFVNNHHQDLEGIYIFPIPKGASITDFSMFVGERELKGEILDKGQARKIYEEIVRRKKDPALLEYYDQGMFRARVYPIPAKGRVRIRIKYSEILKKEEGILSYTYLLSTEKFSQDPLERAGINIDLSSDLPIETIYSPTHDIKIEKLGNKQARITYTERGTKPDKDFKLFYTVSRDEIGFHILTYGNFFLGLLSPQADISSQKVVGKNIVLILDSSGSMSGDKIRQAKDALVFCLNNLNPQDKFNLIDFDDRIRSLRSSLVPATAQNIKEGIDFISLCSADGGTNINDALLEGLNQIKNSSSLSMIVFLTDGLPTVGQTDIKTILQNISQENRTSTRLFVFGLGYDVNTNFLDNLAEQNKGLSDYIKPGEDIEVKVSSFYRKVANPILSDVQLEFTGVEVYDIYPSRLPDIFKGTQLVILGKFKGDHKAGVVLTGKVSGMPKTFRYEADFEKKSDADFVPKLWATRRIGYLIDQIRLHGENREIIDEIVRLSREYGIITEYTSYLIDADSHLSHSQSVEYTAQRMADLKEEVGSLAVNQALGVAKMKGSRAPADAYIDSQGKLNRISQVITSEGKTFFNRNGIWIDASYDGNRPTLKIKKFSQAYFKLLNNLPGLGKYFSLGQEIIICLDGIVLEIANQGEDNLTEDELKKIRY